MKAGRVFSAQTRAKDESQNRIRPAPRFFYWIARPIRENLCSAPFTNRARWASELSHSLPTFNWRLKSRPPGPLRRLFSRSQMDRFVGSGLICRGVPPWAPAYCLRREKAGRPRRDAPTKLATTR